MMKKIVIYCMTLALLVGCSQKTAETKKPKETSIQLKTYTYQTSSIVGDNQPYRFIEVVRDVKSNNKNVEVKKTSSTDYSLIAKKAGKSTIQFIFNKSIYKVTMQIYDKDNQALFSKMPAQLQEYGNKYPEVKAFVLGYLPQKHNDTSTPDISWEIDAYLKYHQVPYFYQYDERWGYREYGQNYMAISGCGPTAMSMVYTYLTQKTDMNPLAMADWANKEGYYKLGYGTNYNFFTQGAAKLGLKCELIQNNAKGLDEALQANRLVVMNVKEGDFTKSGHYILIVGKQDGQLVIHDPNSRLHSHQLWDENRVIAQNKQMFAYYL
ncbi:C39 family peptidase [Sharpea porci]|uniref:C39 family peptidase n=1 Tax=Sharpea porci TaxID=2652286 RepID=UPI002A91AF5E|nr:C39 family peptidase [Sharpea porci]MDY5280008.1 C39 family peptidase [Sharpea porci]